MRGSRRTSKPITSYGIILFSMHPDGSPRFLIYQRRDSYEYMDFLRGIWGSEQRVRELLSQMSRDERERLRRYGFRELWDDLWTNHSCHIYKDGYERGSKKYDSIQKSLPYLLDTTSHTVHPEPPWGFPKGKKNVSSKDSEQDIECALREFTEETRIPSDQIMVWPKTSFSEFYRGNNGKTYCTYYYLAECRNVIPIIKVPTPGCIRSEAVSEEAADAIWGTYSQVCSKLDPRRQNILQKVLSTITNDYIRHSPIAAG